MSCPLPECDYVVWVCSDWRARDEARPIIEKGFGQDLELISDRFVHHFAAFASGDLDGLDLYLIAPSNNSDILMSSVLSSSLSHLLAIYDRCPVAVFSTGSGAGDPDSTPAIRVGDVLVATSAITRLKGAKSVAPGQAENRTDTAKPQGQALWQAFAGP